MTRKWKKIPAFEKAPAPGGAAEKLRIAQVAPLAESVPPHYYGGTERVVSWLTEELVNQGHHVTLFASGDSVTRARLAPMCERSLRMDKNRIDRLAHHIRMIEEVFKRADEFDVIHFHTDYIHFPLSRRHAVPTVTTLHGRLDIPDLKPVFREFSEIPLVSISNAQRTPLSWVNWQGTVYHGLPPASFTAREAPGNYLAFLGRVSPEKRLDRAIEIAELVGMRLLVAAKIDDADRDYFQSVIAPLLRRSNVEYIGEISEAQKKTFLAEAYALLFPIDWPEPFGLVMIESMACGTPVIAYRRGAVPEIMADGVTGYVVNELDEAVQATRKLTDLNRKRCREYFERRFSVDRMTEDYLEIYRRLRAANGKQRPERQSNAG